MTVGSVRIDTADDRPVSYMMEETGVGSGTIHYSENVFGDEPAALARAKELCDERDKDDAKREEDRRRHLKKEVRKPYWNCDLERLRSACLKYSAKEVWRELTGMQHLRPRHSEKISSE
jgi:hypothetical protein